MATGQARTKGVKAAAASASKTRKSMPQRTPIPPKIINPGDAAMHVGEIPEVKVGGAKSTKYRDVLAGVRKLGKGKSVRIAEYAGRAGANTAKRHLEAGDYLIDGKPGDWRFDARTNETGSELWATLR